MCGRLRTESYMSISCSTLRQAVLDYMAKGNEKRQNKIVQKKFKLDRKLPIYKFNLKFLSRLGGCLFITIYYTWTFCELITNFN